MAVFRLSKEIREYQEGTWITDHMKEAYIKLHNLELASSVEVYKDEKLVGGLYGVKLRMKNEEFRKELHWSSLKVAFYIIYVSSNFYFSINLSNYSFFINDKSTTFYTYSCTATHSFFFKNII